jgi:UDP-N-acetylmuramate--alanine ligase
MSGIARLFLRRGVKVSGSDIKESGIISELRQCGAEVFLGHSAENLRGADVIVYTSAVNGENPEITEARKRGIPLLKRAEALAELMAGRSVIAVTGSHGKTTSTSLASCLLLEAGLSPVVSVGGILRNINTNACDGDGKFFVAEADESDGSFLYYRPKYSIITNIDREHLDYYKDFSRVLESYGRFISQTDKDGCVFGFAGDAHVAELLRGYGGRKVLFGFSPENDIYPENVRLDGLSSTFECRFRGRDAGNFRLPLGGMHNVGNALAVIALGFELGIGRDVICRALSGYQGAKRRLEIKFQDGEHILIDDYAHHPTEIKATLSAVRQLKRRRVVAVFQPHRYTRTSLLSEEFCGCFGDADYIILTDIYSAGEDPIAGVSGEGLCRMVSSANPGKKVVFIPKEEIADRISALLLPGDCVITLGAGDISRICDELSERFQGAYQGK